MPLQIAFAQNSKKDIIRVLLPPFFARDSKKRRKSSYCEELVFGKPGVKLRAKTDPSMAIFCVKGYEEKNVVDQKWFILYF